MLQKEEGYVWAQTTGNEGGFGHQTKISFSGHVRGYLKTINSLELVVMSLQAVARGLQTAPQKETQSSPSRVEQG